MKRTNSSARWLNEHLNDHYVKQAKKIGYRSRAAFKLLEIDKKDRLLKPGMLVVDLGASPGGWSQVASGRVGSGGQVFALDVLPMQPLPQVDFLLGDFNNNAVVLELLKRVDNRRVDLVMSDLSPNISGIVVVDQARAFALCEQALAFVQQTLKPGGNFLIKVFQGQGFGPFLRALNVEFANVHVRKPSASRGRSQEVYLVAMGYQL